MYPFLPFAVIQCPPPNNGSSSYYGNAVDVIGSQERPEYVYLDMVEYHCDPGHHTDTENVTRTCQANKTWSGMPLNCIREL